MLVNHVGGSIPDIRVHHSLHLVQNYRVVAAAIAGGRSRGFPASRLQGDLELAAVLQVGRNASRPEAVAGDLPVDAGGKRLALVCDLRVV